MKKMKELSGSEDVYTTKWLKERLKKKYEDHIYFAEVNGKKCCLFQRDCELLAQ